MGFNGACHFSALLACLAPPEKAPLQRKGAQALAGRKAWLPGQNNQGVPTFLSLPIPEVTPNSRSQGPLFLVFFLTTGLKARRHHPGVGKALLVPRCPEKPGGVRVRTSGMENATSSLGILRSQLTPASLCPFL